MSTLTQLFTSIANSIRAKKGTQALIQAEDFPTEIADLPLGKLTNEQYADANRDLNNILSGLLLPSEYQQVEYLESSGTQYIDIGRVPNNTDIIEQKFQSKGSGDSSTISWYGSMPSSSSATPRISMGATSSTRFIGVNQTANISDGKTDLTYLKWQVIGVRNYLVTQDDETFEKTAPQGSAYNPTIQLTSYLFARHGNSGVQAHDGLGTKIYFHREYLANGTLQLNLIPCYRKSDDEPGMYDTVSGTFLTNLGTGTFVVGDDVDPLNIKIQNVLNDKLINAKTEDIRTGKTILGILGSLNVNMTDAEYVEGIDTTNEILGLDSSYTRIEYIESTGSQYIDLDYIEGSTTDFVMKLATTNENPSSIKRIMGGYTSSNRFELALAHTENGLFLNYSNAPVYTEYVPEVNVPFEIKKIGTKLIAPNGEINLTSNTFSSGKSSYLFASNRTSTEKFIGRIYYCKLYENNEVIRSLIPCIRNSDDEIGMYDLATGRFFTNSGTSTFIAGPVIN